VSRHSPAGAAPLQGRSRTRADRVRHEVHRLCAGQRKDVTARRGDLAREADRPTRRRTIAIKIGCGAHGRCELPECRFLAERAEQAMNEDKGRGMLHAPILSAFFQGHSVAIGVPRYL
jgi:hypothetical protein